jgi:diguanylate cyclase (GGDEF)-like protein
VDVSKVRKDFVCYIVDDEESIRGILIEALGGAGYTVEAFPTAEAALQRVQEAPPHVMLSDIRMPGMSGIQLLEKVRQLSSDIQFIVMTSHASLETAINAIRLGDYDYLHKPFEDIADVVVTVDRTIEKLYLQYQNEQLLEELGTKNNALTDLNARIAREKEEVVRINNLMGALTRTKELSDTIQVFLEHTSQLAENSKVLFLRYLPSYYSLLLSHAASYQMEEGKKIGLNLKEIDPKKIMDILRLPQEMDLLKNLLTGFFGVDKYLAAPVETEDEFVGIVVVCRDMSNTSMRRVFDSFMQIFKVSYSNAALQKRIHNMAIRDPLTGLYNRRYFNEKLDEEISRSRRTKMPVSLVYMDIDHFKKYNDQNGHPMGDQLLKMFSTILAKTSRKNDIVSRIGGEEFVIILPHTDAQGAAIKAEKLRRTIESTKFPFAEKQPMGFVSSSIGVSEYPTLAGDPESLVKAADDALYKIKSTTRNRVGLAEAPPGFKPDFVPIPVVPAASRDGE